MTRCASIMGAIVLLVIDTRNAVQAYPPMPYYIDEATNRPPRRWPGTARACETNKNGL